MSKTVQVKLRAFEIINNKPDKAHSDLADKLRNILNDKKVNDRRMILNAEDPKREEDLISDFHKGSQSTQPVFCTMLRIALGNNVQHIGKDLFLKDKFTISELKDTSLDAEAIYLNHYYFSVSNNFLVTNLQGNFTITRLQTYLNYILEDLYEINPVIANEVMPKLSNIKNIIVRDNNVNLIQKNNGSTDENQRTFIQLGIEYLRDIFKETKSLTDIQLEQIISAKLVIEFKKIKKTDSEELQKIYGALLKPVADLDNYEFVTKNNTKLAKGKDILLVREVAIETTETKMLSEVQLSQEMEKFIVELENGYIQKSS